MPAPPTLHRRLGSKSCVLLAWVILLAPFQAHAADKTNLVFILTDNQAPGRWAATAIATSARLTSTAWRRKGCVSLAL